MFFNSLSFLFFFPAVVLVYFLLPQKYRPLHLLIASSIFYMSFIPVYIFILFFTIIIDYIAGIYIEKARGSKRKIFLLSSIFANVGVLVIFKYYNFINDNLSYLAHTMGLNYPIPLLQIILPIGLSFHTFQAMSYTIEVYRKKQKAERNIIIYATYVMFFPQLVAGPIERPQNLIHQFKERHNFDLQRFSEGAKLMLWGFFKKVVIADRLSILVDTVYGNVGEFTGLSLILATVFFAFQIYCDFSGYSDIAIGSAQVMGIKLMDNFNRPYHSKSISEFWKRWHISLSSWFRDYLYIPLGGSRVSVQQWYFNLLFVFIVSGLWHGAAWTFVVWGALHGVYLISSIITSPIREKLKLKTGLAKKKKLDTTIRIFFTFILVCVGWIFFRAQTLAEGYYVLTHLFINLSSGLGKTNLGLDKTELIIAFASIIFMEFVHAVQAHKGMRNFLSTKPQWVRWTIYITLIITILIFGVFENKKFIYFQF